MMYIAVQNSDIHMIGQLLEVGFDVNSVLVNGMTALHLAATHAQSVCVVDYLLNEGARVDVVDDEGKTPLFMSHEHEDDDDDDDDVMNDDDPDRELALRRRQCRIMRLMLDKDDTRINHISDFGESAFHRALSSGDENIIELFLERRVNIHIRNPRGQSSLHIAARYASENIVGSLIDLGADVDARNFTGTTPLHIASKLKRTRIMELLLDNGADINAEDTDGHTPMYYAARTYVQWEKLLPYLYTGYRL